MMNNEVFVGAILGVIVLVHGTEQAVGTGQKRKFKSFEEDAYKTLAVRYAKVDNVMKKHVEPICIERMPDTEGSRKVREHIINNLQPLGWTVEEDRFEDRTPWGMKNFANIIATYNPNAEKRLVVACHYDSKNMTSDGFVFLGATDSAVPCAIMLDTVEKLNCLLKKGPKTKKYKDLTLQLIFFDGEEAYVRWSEQDSIYGARHLAERWEREQKLDSITDFVLLDLIGTYQTAFRNFFTQTAGLYDQLYKIEEYLQKNKMLADSHIYRRMFARTGPTGGGIQDDHIPFLARNVNILHLISAPFPDVWHTRSDNVESLDTKTIDNFSRIFRVFVASYLHLDASYSECR